MNEFKKQPSEKYPISLDFTNILGEGESISTLYVTATNLSDNEVATTTVIDSSLIDGLICKAIVKDGVSKSRYKITFKIITSSSNVYEDDIFMYVKEI